MRPLRLYGTGSFFRFGPHQYLNTEGSNGFAGLLRLSGRAPGAHSDLREAEDNQQKSTT